MKKEKSMGITLIALVITIIVLLILAGITISTLTGQNGILTQATNSKEKNEIARVEETVRLAVSESLINHGGIAGDVTLQDVRDIVRKNEKTDKITAESLEGANSNGFPANIVFPPETTTINKEIKVPVNEDLEVGNSASGGNPGTDSGDVPDGIYNEPNVTPSPNDLFLYEVIDDVGGKVAIVSLNPKYCNSEYGEIEGIEDTHYDVLYQGEKIDILVVPYETEIEGKKYTITEVSMCAPSRYLYGVPNVTEIIYPNTVTKVYSSANGAMEMKLNETVKKVVLPSGLIEIGSCAFSKYSVLESVQIPNTVTTIGYSAFSNCMSLQNIILPDSVTSIEQEAFRECTQLKSITIPDSVQVIRFMAFNGCSELTSIVLPKELTSIEGYVFEYCRNLTSLSIGNKIQSIDESAFSSTSGLENIYIDKPENSIPGSPWGADSSVIIHWNSSN